MDLEGDDMSDELQETPAPPRKLGYMAAITYRLPANQIWMAFIAGLGLAAILLTWRFNRLSKVT